MTDRWRLGALVLVLLVVVGVGLVIFMASGQVIYDTWLGREEGVNREPVPNLQAGPETVRSDAGELPTVIYADYKDGLTTNVEANRPEMVSLLKGLKSESPGVAGWLVGFANSEKVVFYNHAHMLTYDIANRRFTSAIDLAAIDADHIQGSIVTNFAFSPDGRYVIINNGLGEREPNWTAKMYLGDLQTGSVREIASANYVLIAGAWSANSRYYAFVDRSGAQATVYDVVDGTSKSASFGQGEIKRILVSDNGNIVAEAESIFLLTKDKDQSYHSQDLGLQGNILALSGSKLVYYAGQAIREYYLGTGADRVVQNMQENLELSSVDREQVTFVSMTGLNSVVYNLRDGRLYEYSYSIESFPQLWSWSLSPDSQYCVVPDGDGHLFEDAKGNQGKIQVANDKVFSLDGGWIDNHTFVTVLIRYGSSGMAGDFKIVAYDLEKHQRNILYEQ